MGDTLEIDFKSPVDCTDKYLKDTFPGIPVELREIPKSEYKFVKD